MTKTERPTFDEIMAVQPNPAELAKMELDRLRNENKRLRALLKETLGK
jgi:hypothetical protein